MLTGKNVCIRTMERQDLPAVKAVNEDLSVRGNVVGWGWPASLKQMERWHETTQGGETHRWVVTDFDGQVIGVTGLWEVDLQSRHALTALKIGGPHGKRGQGAGSDAIKLVMAFSFYDLGLNRLYTSILEDNEASQRAYLRKCGWTVEGVSRQHVWRHGAYRNLLQAGILKREFDQLADAREYVTSVTGDGVMP